MEKDKKRCTGILLFLCILGSIVAAAGTLPRDLQRDISENDTAKIRLRYNLGFAAAVTRIGYWDSLAKEAHIFNRHAFEERAFYALGYSYFVLEFKDKSLNYFNRSYAIVEKTENTADQFPPMLMISRVFYM